MSRDKFERRVADRLRLIMQAERFAPNAHFDPAATDDHIRAKAVDDKLGPAAIDGKSADYIHAYFDHLAEQEPIDPVRRIMLAGVKSH